MADIKISALPLTTDLTGSVSVLPIVIDGTTFKVTNQRLAQYAAQYSATTASNTFIGNQTINGDVTITGVLKAQ
jgi:hypothetical protein